MAATFVLLKNKATFSNATVIGPRGIVEHIGIPYSSNQDGDIGMYTYSVTLKNSILFSGTLHVTPDDCITSIRINGQLQPELLKETQHICDCINGLYIDLKPYLSKGNNQIIMEIRNTHGFYGLKMIDKTFYEKYTIGLCLIFILLFVNLKQLFLYLRDQFYVVFQQNPSLSWLLSGQLLVFVLLILAGMRHDLAAPWYKWSIIALLISCVWVPLNLSIYKKFLYGKAASLLFLFSISISVAYLIVLPHDVFSYDYEGHLSYIRYIMERGHVPVSSGGWSFYHPSLYYLSITLLLKITNAGGYFTPEELPKIIQACSLLFFMVYIYFSLKTIDKIFRSLPALADKKKDRIFKTAYLLTIAIFLYWPSNAIVSVRVGNDILFDLFYAMSFYFIVCWWFSKKTGAFAAALIFAALDVWSKTNGLMLFGLIGCLLVIRYFLDKEKTRDRTRYFSKLCLLGIFSLFVGYYAFQEKFERLKADPDMPIIVGNANGLGPGFLVENKPANFFFLNPVKFINIPFTSSLDPTKGRENFWFYLTKSSLFGEFSPEGEHTVWFAKILSFFFLLFWTIGSMSFYFAFKQKEPYTPVLANICLLIIAMIVFRIYYPYSCSNDFRYIYPAVLPFAILTGSILLFLTNSRWLRYLTMGIMLCFLIAAVSFQLNVLHGYPIHL
ncbi:hypothetical protein [Pedobacter caeni]|uniref:Dolichyl-phosphate-mannose-protein mannosyltransferase n=1 Tax=Pedobacter caeni TaxID=288992 RepID=A0A1M5C1C3_9SPHI|nr:hypothetical protein [Pedobacter caeni]SHF48548.1 hypothetical protein SAMN04488522_1021452 [Pedobacter caeni]